MKKYVMGVIASASLLTALIAVRVSAQNKTFDGEIMDQQCAFLGGHSAMQNKGESAKDCTNRCVSIGGKYVLYDASSKTAYQLDDQKKPQAFAGAKVQVTGSLDSSTKTIHVASIKAAS